jgi:hypothetical protein
MITKDEDDPISNHKIDGLKKKEPAYPRPYGFSWLIKE